MITYCGGFSSVVNPLEGRPNYRRSLKLGSRSTSREGGEGEGRIGKRVVFKGSGAHRKIWERWLPP